jgi:hypothetical protein
VTPPTFDARGVGTGAIGGVVLVALAVAAAIAWTVLR